MGLHRSWDTSLLPVHDNASLDRLASSISRMFCTIFRCRQCGVDGFARDGEKGLTFRVLWRLWVDVVDKVVGEARVGLYRWL